MQTPSQHFGYDELYTELERVERERDEAIDQINQLRNAISAVRRQLGYDRNNDPTIEQIRHTLRTLTA